MTPGSWRTALMKLAGIIVAAILVPQSASAQASRADAERLIVMISHPEQDSVVGAGIIFGVSADRLYIATANHIIQKGRTPRLDSVEVEFRFLRGEPFTAKVLNDVDRDLDLAVLVVPNLSRQGIPTNEIPFELLGDPRALRERAEVFMIGNPVRQKWRPQFSPAATGRISSDRLEFETVLAQPGHSGGGLFESGWRLVGMIVEDASPLPRAVPIDQVLQRLARWGYRVSLVDEQNGSPDPPIPSDQDERLKGVPDSFARYLEDTDEGSLHRAREINLKYVQSALKVLGHYSARVDGLSGPGTDRAIAAWRMMFGSTFSDGLRSEEIVTLMKLGAEDSAEVSAYLGVMYGLGLGVAPDEKKSRELLNSAESDGFAKAGVYLKNIEETWGN